MCIPPRGKKLKKEILILIQYDKVNISEYIGIYGSLTQNY